LVAIGKGKHEDMVTTGQALFQSPLHPFSNFLFPTTKCKSIIHHHHPLLKTKESRYREATWLAHISVGTKTPIRAECRVLALNHSTLLEGSMTNAFLTHCRKRGIGNMEKTKKKKKKQRVELRF